MRTFLAEMGHKQPPTPVARDNTTANIIVNRTANQKIYRAIDMRFYWVRDIIKQTISTYSGKRERKPGRLCHKNHPKWHHRAMRPKYVKATKVYIYNSKDRRTGTVRGCAGTTNPRGIRKT